MRTFPGLRATGAFVSYVDQRALEHDAKVADVCARKSHVRDARGVERMQRVGPCSGCGAHGGAQLREALIGDGVQDSEVIAEVVVRRLTANVCAPRDLANADDAHALLGDEREIRTL